MHRAVVAPPNLPSLKRSVDAATAQDALAAARRSERGSVLDERRQLELEQVVLNRRRAQLAISWQRQSAEHAAPGQS